MLHDILEDYPDIGPEDLEPIVGKANTNSIMTVSKYIKGKLTLYHDPHDYYFRISCDDRASIVKGCDRIHNLKTMGGVFTLDKQEAYVKETEDYFLVMLKQAAGLFPMQHLAYMNIRTMLKTQVELISATVEAGKAIG